MISYQKYIKMVNKCILYSQAEIQLPLNTFRSGCLSNYECINYNLNCTNDYTLGRNWRVVDHNKIVVITEKQSISIA